MCLGRVNGQRRVELQHILQESARSLKLVGAVDGEVLTHGHDLAVTDVQQLVCRVHTGRKTLEVRLLDDTLVLVVTQREKGGAVLGTLAQRDVILLN